MNVVLADIISALQDDYGHHTEQADMKLHLLQGEFGLNGMLDIVISRFLDRFPVEHASYQAVLEIFSTFSTAMFKRLTNLRKVSSINSNLVIASSETNLSPDFSIKTSKGSY